jgi:hypothetical protein
MHVYGPQSSLKESKGFTIARSTPNYVPLNIKTVGFLAVVVLFSNLFTYAFIKPGTAVGGNAPLEKPGLFLMEEASAFVQDLEGFENKVRKIGKTLRVPPEWLMAVMYSESKFDAGVANFKGSGAIGLIQWMPATAKEMNTSPEKLKSLPPVEQLDYVYDYLQTVRRRYCEYESLTELYLGILYPKALDQDQCYTLYSTPSRAYKQNSGLDENKDGRVTVSDIDKRMKRKFPKAYHSSL